MNKKHILRHGSALEHGDAHEREHQLWTRRDFLSATGLLGAGSLLLGNIPVRAFQPTPLLAGLSIGGPTDRILLLIRLDGGNDGLNTVIQRGNQHYYDLRPTIAIQENQMWTLNNQYGMPVQTNALQPLWTEGMMKVLFNVGYPNPNYSHFRSSDIIVTGTGRDEVKTTGWLGRFLDNDYPAFLETPPSVPPALQIGVEANLIFSAENANMALAVSSPQEFYQIALTGQLFPVNTLGNTRREQELLYVRQTANAAFRYAETIRAAYDKGKNQVTYPTGNKLAEQMAIIARLIKGNLGTRIFMVDIADFDTHVLQRDNQLSLLQQLATSVRAFYDDLAYANSGLEEKVLGMTFSEFGRTIYENGSKGTDHGAGTHTLLFGGGIGNGFVGDYQDLSNPDPVQDPVFSVDFRDIYATVLQDWLGYSSDLATFVLGRPTPTLPGLVPALAPALGDNRKCALLGHHPHADLPGVIEIKYAIMQDGDVRLQLLSRSGQVLRTLLSGGQSRGTHIYPFKPAEWHVAPGEYVYRLQSGGQAVERELRI